MQVVQARDDADAVLQIADADALFGYLTPRLLQAAYNYTFVLRDPGAAFHNGRYSLQLLYDSLESLAASGKAGVNMGNKVRPQ